MYRQTCAATSEPFANPVLITTGGEPDISENGRTLIVETDVGLAMLTCL